MGGGGDFLFAGMSAGGKPHRPATDLLPQLGEGGRVGGEGLRCRLQIADTGDNGRAEPAKPLCLQFVLRET